MFSESFLNFSLVEWHCCVEKCQEGQSFRLHTKMSQKIALLPMFPSIPVEMVCRHNLRFVASIICNNY